MSFVSGDTRTEGQKSASLLPVRTNNTHTVLVCATEPLDVAGAVHLRERTRSLVRNCRRMVIDLGTADYVDSSGVRMLLSLAEELEAEGKELRLVVPPGSRVERTLMLLQLMDRLQACPTLPEAWTPRRN